MNLRELTHPAVTRLTLPAGVPAENVLPDRQRRFRLPARPFQS